MCRAGYGELLRPLDFRQAPLDGKELAPDAVQFLRENLVLAALGALAHDAGESATRDATRLGWPFSPRRDSVALLDRGGNDERFRQYQNVGQPRGIGFGILLFIVTLGFYGWYWVYKTEEEMKQHTGDGLGGVLGLVVWILLSPVMAFVIPSEVGKMYEKDGQQPPVTGWTGLWLFPFGIFIIPAIVWFVKVQESLNRYWEGKVPEAVATAPA